MALLTLLAGRPCRDDEHAERMREIYVVVGGGGVRWAAAVGGVHGRRKTRFTIVQSMQTGHLPRLPVTGHARLTLHIICATVAAINIIFTGLVGSGRSILRSTIRRNTFLLLTFPRPHRLVLAFNWSLLVWTRVTETHNAFSAFILRCTVVCWSYSHPPRRGGGGVAPESTQEEQRQTQSVVHI